MWTQDIPLNEYFKHWYEPESRNAALNSSNTVVNNVDFTDESLIPVSGYVRYENTACFQAGVEIKLNGASLLPPLLTDADGKFIVDLEPGSSDNILTCVYKDHEFKPAYIELPMIVQPITGLFFDDKTTRTITGFVAGGKCKYPITPKQGKIQVTFASVNGCIEKTAMPDEIRGFYESPDLPPLIYNVSVDHPDPTIDASFTADTLSLEKVDRQRDFIYRAAPQVEFADLPRDSLNCQLCVVKQLQPYQVKIQVFESYNGMKCPIDSFRAQIFDNFSDTTYTAAVPMDTVFANGLYPLYFTPREPNILGGGDHPYQKNLEIVITDNLDRQASAKFWAIVTGEKKWDGNNFTTTTSQMPWFVLRTPPGDGSYTYFSKDQEITNTTSFQKVDADGNATNETLHLGFDKTVMTGFGVAIETEWSITLDAGHGWEGTVTDTDIDEVTTTFSRSETYSTSGDGLTGDDATVFVGGGVSMTYGIATKLSLNPNCQVALDTTMIADFNGFSSTYMYTRYHIENTLIPNLQFQYNETKSNTTLEALKFWKDLLKTDSIAVATALPAEAFSFGEYQNTSNLSFDAGVSMEYLIATGNSHATGTVVTNEDTHEAFGEAGFSIDAFGMSAMYAHTWYNATEESNTNDQSNTQTIGFVLDDDDPGDAFTVNVFQDPMWSMPVFKVLGGQSSCPWEDKTVKRHVANISVTPSLLVDVPPDEPAVLTLYLGNNSETGESDSYILSAVNESNPHGAQLVTSDNLANGVSYGLEAGEVIPITLQVFRGPEAYNYDNLTLDLSPACGGQDETSDQVTFSVHFQVPCSESQIISPETGWLIDSSAGSDTMWVTVSGYNWPVDTFMTAIELQYRPTGGGNWFTAYTAPADSLIDKYVLIPFNTSPAIINDGAYELRSRALCTGGKYPGVSAVVSGVIDRTAPQVVGLPEPVDGILGPDDLIRVTFNEAIACSEIKPGAGDILLFNTVTGKAMDYRYTCGGNVITFEPNVQNMFIENQIFRGEIHNLQDSHGNRRADPVVWEFYVNRNPIAWSGSNIDRVVLFVDEEYSTERQLVNNGGSNRSWDIIGGREGAMPSGAPLSLPDWLRCSPQTGTLTPNESQDVAISLVKDLNFGEYKTTIYAAGAMGDEPLSIDIRKLCYPPAWQLKSALYQYTMTLTATLSVDSLLSDDIYDMVGVFVGDELRSVANVQYVPALEPLANSHPYEVFLTVYSNKTSGEELEFRVWDASHCRELGMIQEKYTFQANSNYGTPTSPAAITATSQVIYQSAFPRGWTWFSLNIDAADMSVNSVLKSLEPAAGDLVKSQTRFNQYVAGYGWVGTLDTLGTTSMYLIHLSQADTLELVGYPVDVETDSIPIVSGWNWVGFTPQNSQAVNFALTSLEGAATGDLIKSQNEYAQFVEGLGWIGSLQYMDPKQGYLLSAANPGVLVYPFYQENNYPLAKPDQAQIAASGPKWIVNPFQYQYNMTITSMVQVNDLPADSSADMLAAFVANPAVADSNWECRGVAQACYVPYYDRFMFFLMVYSNLAQGETIQFRFYDASDNIVYYIPTEVIYQSNAMVGAVETPWQFIARPMRVGDPSYVPEEFMLSDCFPNPFNGVTKIGYGIPQKCQMQIVIYNMLGHKVRTLVVGEQLPGYRFITWDGLNDQGQSVASGIYLIEITAGNPARGVRYGLHKVNKMTLLK
jgi:hypothetical protein